jgi:hemolysin III
MSASIEYSVGEEIANSVTHGIGALLSVAALTIMVVYAAMASDPWCTVSVSVFGTSLVLMYLASTLYHALPQPRIKRLFRKIDHCTIYFLIAGTYTPFLLVNLRGPWGWSLFVFLWVVAIAGSFFKLFFIDKGAHLRWWDKVSTGLYVAMGWTIVIALKPTLELVPVPALLLMALGGLAYTSGVVFYLWQRLPYNHAIWHLFVLAGSTFHFFAVFCFVVPET